MAFVSSAPLSASVVPGSIAKTHRLPQCKKVPVVAHKISMGMSGVFRSYLQSSTKNYVDSSANKKWSTRAPPLSDTVPSQELDGAKDTVKPREAGRADAYMAEKCVTAAYKAIANPTGVYDPSCTEGAAKQQAEQSRELANLAKFRMLQRSTVAKYFDYFETRKMATSMAHGCSYEETLVSNFPLVSRAMVRGYSEAKSLCVRYSSGNSAEETYMAKAVDMQYKAKAVPGGVYGVQCSDGNTTGLAEFKRVQALAARFRANQMAPTKKEQAKLDAKKYARSMFRTCNYEEHVFNAYPAVASSMRPLTARY